MKQLMDVAIIGGGPAGLSAALVLGRARKSVIVIDEERPRNRVTKESHGFLTRDGIKPSEFRQIARQQISVYPTVLFENDTAIEVTGTDGEFIITTAKGLTFGAKKLLFAVGMKDLPLDMEGLTDVYGKSAFVCPYCDGWEMRDRKLVIITNGDRALHFAKTIAGWTSQYAICTDGPDEMTDEQREELKRHDIPVFASKIQRIEAENGNVQQVVLEDGSIIACEGIFFVPKLAIGSNLPQALGCEMTEAGAVIVDDFGKTNVPGVYSAGDAASQKYQVVAAASMGSMAAVSINSELLGEAWSARG
ncbi:pyridine nucleotide-disulfide oxidoreductase [Paenibacillus sp. BIHB 4019]|uniref:Pyridine nucleotide-disulfide oxidoreductase n=1 Tax=Paenibacillus sp. BIHB 4019 TaxID=1870819 RepID=A0A1B2DNC1_9BACL|nr:NAD(P)/FAD-dependent oxidoreductase [Paenibacillus sp. BIHB 4019]ANY69197.1 pyridine nucleotide-disulfide oxidoreductase [Paenibacillus sp. BIHB 4019]